MCTELHTFRVCFACQPSTAPALPLPACGYSIHTSQNPILRQWVTRTHPLGQPRTPDPSQGIRKTHVFPLRISTERIKSVHSTAARGERERDVCAQPHMQRPH